MGFPAASETEFEFLRTLIEKNMIPEAVSYTHLDVYKRQLLADLRTHSLAEGGSTLTQQLAKNELFTQDKHLARKAAEMLAAFDIEKTYSKQQIFETVSYTHLATSSLRRSSSSSRYSS